MAEIKWRECASCGEMKTTTTQCPECARSLHDVDPERARALDKYHRDLWKWEQGKPTPPPK